MKEIILLSRSVGCSNCTNVKRVFSSLGIQLREIDIDTEPAKAAPYLNKATSRSLPLMFVGGENVAAGLGCITEARRYAN